MDQTKIDAMLQELQQQALAMGTRAAAFAGELAVANQRVQTLTAQVEALAKELDALKPKEPQDGPKLVA